MPVKSLFTAAVVASFAAPSFADEIWVTNEKDDTVSVIDVASQEVIKTYPTGERPRGVTFSHDYKVLYICASDSEFRSGDGPEYRRDFA